MTTPRIEDTLVPAGTRCQKENEYRPRAYSGGQCTRKAKVAEPVERQIGYGSNSERVTILKFYCTQHSKGYAEQVRERRSQRYQTSNRVNTYRAVQAEIGRLAVQVLRLQGTNGGISPIAPNDVEGVIAERDMLKREVERLTS